MRIPKLRLLVNKNVKWLWENHPEILISGVAAVMSFGPALYFFVYKQWYLRGIVSWYKSTYTVWRPDNSHVDYMRNPNDYPPPYLTVRDNYRFFNADKDYE
ncbi:hypothetical protein T07_5962 [Trichinella nelsoni]|nr:hypothetical protein T07_5962 [Trichinella nelsoni]KRZ49624.1 hypothetical protein T02_11258 [Trichinella nativa]